MRAPDGQPARRADVSLLSADRYPPVGETRPRAAAATDDEGVARFRWPAGVSRMLVAVKGVG